MTSPSSLLALEGKLVEAKGPDHEIDALLYCATMKSAFPDETPEQHYRYALRASPEYTASIDAALALVSRCLPECPFWRISSRPDGTFRSVVDWPGRDPCATLLDQIVTAPTPALAICLALIRALAAKEQ